MPAYSVEDCYNLAKDNSDYDIFALQFGGECWAGNSVKDSYNKHGEIPSGCSILGDVVKNQVYQIKKKPTTTQGPTTTKAATATPTGNPSDVSTAVNLNSAALYIGTGGTLICRVVGGNTTLYNSDPGSGYTIFYNIPDGTFFPVIVSAVWGFDGDSIDTTCSNIVALY